MTASVSETVPGVDDFAAEWNAWHGLAGVPWGGPSLT